MHATYTYYIGALAAVFIALTAPLAASAQKYPERRATRFGTRDYLRGDYAGAEQRYRRAQELNPEFREAQFNLGDALWRQAQSLAPAAQQGVSGAQGVQGPQGQEPTEEQKALQALMQQAAEAWTGVAADSLAPAPLVAAASYNAGNAALAGQQIDAAIEAYKSALRLTPGDMQAKFNLAYAQKLKRQQEQQNDQNQDQNKDDQGGGGGDQNDPNKDNGDGDQNKDNGGGNDNQNNDGNPNDKDGDGKDDPQNGDGQNDSNGQNDPKNGEGQGGGKPKMDPATAEQMLDAMQAAEDDTREKVEGKKVQATSHSGKNW